MSTDPKLRPLIKRTNKPLKVRGFSLLLNQFYKMSSNSGRFCHLHCHTEYSLLDGCNQIPKMIQTVKELNMPAVAMTDHGVMSGTIQFYKECKKNDIKPLIGCEVYVANRTRHDKQAGIDNRPYHFTLLAQNEVGYRNLIQMVSTAHLEGMYYKPRVDRELLEKHAQGIVALSGCLRGEVNDALLQDNMKLAEQRLGELKDIYQDNLFVELMDHGLPEQKMSNIGLIELAKKMNLPLVATNDAHYGCKDDANIQDILVCVQTGKTVHDTNRMKFFSPEFYLKPEHEMLKAFNGLEQAVYNTMLVADRCELELNLNTVYFPEFPVPDGHSPESYLMHLCEEGFQWRFGTSEPGDNYRERLRTELEVINGKGFASYFLVIWDFIKYAQDNGIPVGPGRGSAAGSLVAYLTGITQLDPIHHGLLFERFLNPERSELPDVDTDFCVERREEVINYCREKYGHDKVAQIITFGRMKARAAIRDVGRVLDVPLPEVDKIAKAVPEGPSVKLSDALEDFEFKKIYEADPTAKKLVDIALKVEGMARNAGIHAAGVVMASEPVSNIVPLQKMSGDEVVAQFDMNDCAEAGLVKMDFLGLRNLTVINHCLDTIEANYGFRLDFDEMETDDPKTYELLGDADTTGVFQLESDGMKKYLKQLRPEKFSDIVAFIALYRPGPLKGGVVDEFIKRRHGKGGGVTYPHEKLQEILEETYGFFIYQEQVMLTANILAGYTLAMADQLRKAMGKKKMEVMAKHRKIFVEGAVERGVDKKVADDIFQTMENFAAYGFNKSHSAAYAIVSYQTAYLKANYRKEYMAALMSSVINTIDKVAFFIKECDESGIGILPPCINNSKVLFSTEENSIRWGMAAIRNVGRNAVEAIVAERDKAGPYRDLAELCSRVDSKIVNKKVLEGLAKSGALDCFKETRATLIENIAICIDNGQRIQKQRNSGQMSLFGGDTPESVHFGDLAIKRQPEFSKREYLALEKEMLGFYLTDSPLSEVIDALRKQRNRRIADLIPDDIDQVKRIGGIISSVKKITTKRGQPMAFLTLEDESGDIEVIVFPKVYTAAPQLLQNDTMVVIDGKIESDDRKNNQQDDEEYEDVVNENIFQYKILAESITPLTTQQVEKSLEDNPGVHLSIQLSQSHSLPRVRDLLLRHRGDETVYLHLLSSESQTTLKLNPEFSVKFSSYLKDDLSKLLGPTSIQHKTASTQQQSY